MADGSLAPYVSEDIDAGLELRALGLPMARYFFEHLQKVAAYKAYRPYWKGDEFCAYRGRKAHKKDRQGCFIVYVVETERDGALRVTLICAGRLAAFADEKAIQAFITPRLEDYFK